MSENNEQFSSEEIREFADKLDDWGASLPHKERSMLQVLLVAAEEAGSEDEVSGFSFDVSKMPSPASLPKIDVTAMRVLGPLTSGKPWVLSAYDEWYPVP